MRRIGLVGLVAVFAAVLIVALSRDDQPAPAPPAEFPAQDPAGQPDPPELFPEAPNTLPPSDAVKQWDVRVITNVPGAIVTLTLHHVGSLPDPEPITKRADIAGEARFDFPEHPEPLHGTWASATAPGHAPARESVRKGVARLTLEKGVAVCGRIVDAQGPVEGVGVYLEGGSHEPSDAEGRFTAWAKAPGEVGLTVRRQGRPVWRTTATAPTADLLLRLPDGLSVSGVVTLPDGTPVPGVWVNTSRPSAGCYTGSGGRHAFSGLPDGEVTVFCRTADDRREVEAGSADVDFVVKKHLIHFRFLDSGGRPFRRAALNVRATKNGKSAGSSVSSGTDAAEWNFFALTGSVVRYCPLVPGYEKTVGEVRVEGEPRIHNIDIVLKREGPKGSIDLVVRGEDGRPLRQVIVTVRNAAESPVGGFYDQRIDLDEQGCARLDGLPTGPLTVLVSTTKRYFSVEGYGLVTQVPAQVRPHQAAAVEAVVQIGGRVSVIVRNRAGEMLPADRLDLLHADGKRYPLTFMLLKEDMRTTMLSEAGPNLLCAPVPPGRYLVKLTRRGADPVTKEVLISGGETIDLEFEVE